jgi:hypothetical protein
MFDWITSKTMSGKVRVKQECVWRAKVKPQSIQTRYVRLQS